MREHVRPPLEQEGLRTNQHTQPSTPELSQTDTARVLAFIKENPRIASLLFMLLFLGGTTLYQQNFPTYRSILSPDQSMTTPDILLGVTTDIAVGNVVLVDVPALVEIPNLPQQLMVRVTALYADETGTITSFVAVPVDRQGNEIGFENGFSPEWIVDPAAVHADK